MQYTYIVRLEYFNTVIESINCLSMMQYFTSLNFSVLIPAHVIIFQILYKTAYTPAHSYNL